MKKVILMFLVGLSWIPLNFAVAGPSWTYEASGGFYYTNDEDWESRYGENRIIEVSGSVAKRIFSVIDLGISFNYGIDKGTGIGSVSGGTGDPTTHEMLLADAFLILRARFTEGQWIVPYAGGGYTRYHYRQTVEGGKRTQGAEEGEHLRGGLQFLLDNLDKASSREIRKYWGVINSYFVLEARKTIVESDNGVDLGGTSYKAGVLLEF